MEKIHLPWIMKFLERWQRLRSININLSKLLQPLQQAVMGNTCQLVDLWHLIMSTPPGLVWPAVPPPPTYPASPTSSKPWIPSPLPWPWAQGWPWGWLLAAPTTAAPCQPPAWPFGLVQQHLLQLHHVNQLKIVANQHLSRLKILMTWMCSFHSHLAIMSHHN